MYPYNWRSEMYVGMVGLGRMGGAMVQRILALSENRVVVYDQDPGAVARAVEVGAIGATSLEDLVCRLPQPRNVWVMLPAGEPTHRTLGRLGAILADGDLVLDGGNTHYVEDGGEAARFQRQGIGFLSVGVSGGVLGLKDGYALMVGGPTPYFRRMLPIFRALKPAGEDGLVHAGEDPRAGHFAKMAHNLAEYVMMLGLAEAYALMQAAAERGILQNVPDIFESWQDGSIVESRLLSLFVSALQERPGLEGLLGKVGHSGECQWAITTGMAWGVPLLGATTALGLRMRSLLSASDADQALSAMRDAFGRHPEPTG